MSVNRAIVTKSAFSRLCYCYMKYENKICILSNSAVSSYYNTPFPNRNEKEHKHN